MFNKGDVVRVKTNLVNYKGNRIIHDIHDSYHDLYVIKGDHGYNGYFFEKDLEMVEKRELKFKFGDKVRHVDRGWRKYREVVKYDFTSYGTFVMVKELDGRESGWFEENLVHVKTNDQYQVYYVNDSYLLPTPFDSEEEAIEYVKTAGNADTRTIIFKVVKKFECRKKIVETYEVVEIV